MATTTVSMTVNGKKVSADVENRTLLVQYLRESLGLTGTHVGCEKTVRHELEGNFCRCTGYHNIVKAILAAHKEMTA